MARFRFEDMEIWKTGVDLAVDLSDLADGLDVKRKHRFAEQLRAAALSISNNIAEGSGSDSKRDFAHFLNIARRSCFENANMLIVFGRKRLIGPEDRDTLLDRLEAESRKIQSFRRSLQRTAQR